MINDMKQETTFTSVFDYKLFENVHLFLTKYER